jgi:hypothetical protein
MNKILQLKNKLHQLASLDIDFEVFGSDLHEYRLNPCLSEAEIQQFELESHITLPIDYRSFLLEVGNGGAGPGYGLFSLNLTATDSSLAQPFPLKEVWNDWDLIEENQSDFPVDEDDEFDDKLSYGTIPIAHYGCGITAILVITGEQRGNIWIDDRANDGGIIPCSRYVAYVELTGEETDEEDDNQPLNFYDWYDNWLNISLSQFIS